MNRKLKIHFILPAMGKTGGVLVVLEYARQFQKMGHDVRVYYPFFPYWIYFNGFSKWKRPWAYLRYLISHIRVSTQDISWIPDTLDLRRVLFISSVFLRDADAIIATAWPTAYSVAHLSTTKGEKLYFVQHYETWHGEEAAVDASYRLPLKLLVIAPWLTELMREKFGRKVTAELHNGIDLDFFSPLSMKPKVLSVLMMYHVLEIKGVSDGLEVLRRLHQVHPEVRIRMFGMYPFREADNFVEYYLNPTPEQLLDLYQTSHIFFSPSLSEGWHLPPMEAMACGCAVVATNVGCIPILKGDGNLLSAEPSDRETLFRHLEFLVDHPVKMAEMAERGHQNILNYSWEKQSKHFEQILLSVLNP